MSRVNNGTRSNSIRSGQIRLINTAAGAEGRAGEFNTSLLTDYNTRSGIITNDPLGNISTGFIIKGIYLEMGSAQSIWVRTRVRFTSSTTTSYTSAIQLPTSSLAQGTNAPSQYYALPSPRLVQGTLANPWQVEVEFYTNSAATSRPDGTRDTADDVRIDVISSANIPLVGLEVVTFPAQMATPTYNSSTKTLSWTAPATGGSAIIGYRIYKDGTLLATVTGATTYTNQNISGSITIAAYNEFGEGVKSPAVSTSNTYTIIYNKNDADATGTMSNTTSSTDAASATLTISSSGFLKTGYRVASWNTAANGSGTAYSSSGSGSITLQQASPTVTLYAQWVLNTFTINYNANGGTGTMTPTTWTYPNSSGNFSSNGFTRANFTFQGWGTSSNSTTPSYQPGDEYTYSLNSFSDSITVYAIWASSAPVFSDQSITTFGYLGKNISTNPDRTVAASPILSSGGYTVVYVGSGLDPTPWLTINSSGELSGTPPRLGEYTFLIRASNGGTNLTDSNQITLTIRPIGKRMTSPTASEQLTIGKRFIGVGQPGADSNGWINLSIMKRYEAGQWRDLIPPV